VKRNSLKHDIELLRMGKRMGILSKCPHCGKRVGSFGLDKKVRCYYCLNEGCTNCFFFVGSESDKDYLYESQRHPIKFLIKGFLMSKITEEEMYCCHETHCFQSFIDTILPFARSQEILRKIVNEPHLQRIYIKSSILKLKNLVEEKKFDKIVIWECFSFLSYSLKRNLFFHDIQKNRDVFENLIEHHLKNDFLGVYSTIEKDEERFNEIFKFFTDVVSLQLLRLYIHLKKERDDLCLENLKDISNSSIHEPLAAIFRGLENDDIDTVQSALDSFETHEGVDATILKTFLAIIKQKIVKNRLFSGRDSKSSRCFLDKLIDLAFKNYDFHTKSLSVHNFIVSWYILAKTGVANHLDVSHMPVVGFGMGRSIRIPKGLYGISSELGALYFYVDAMKSSQRWNQTCIATVKQELKELLRKLSLGGYSDFDFTFWKELWKFPFGEEIVFAYESIGEERIFRRTQNMMRVCVELGSLRKDNLTTLLTIYFDRGKKDAIYYLKYDLFPPEELGRIREFVKNPGKLSKFVETIDSSFAKKRKEEWEGEEARNYRILNATYFLYPELVRGVNIKSKMILIERLNERLANIISSGNIEWNWEILYILRIFEIIGEDLYISSPQKYIETARKRDEIARANIFTEADGILWNYHVGAEINSVSINHEKVVAATSRSVLQLFDESCRLLWRYEIEDVISSVSINQNGYIAAGSYDNYVYLLDKSGNLLWEFDTGCLVNSVSINRKGMVAAGSEDGQVYLFDNSGTLLWQHETDLWVLSVSINREGMVAAGSDNIYLFDKSGNLKWKFNIDYIVNSVSINQEGFVAAGSKNTLFLLEMNGNLCWSFEAESEIETVSVNRDGCIAAGFYDNRIYLFDRPGNLIWEYDTGGVVSSVSINREGYIAASYKETLGLFNNFWTKEKSRGKATEEYNLLISRWEEKGYSVKRLKELAHNPKAFQDEIKRIKEMVGKKKEFEKDLEEINRNLKSLSRQLAEEKITGDQFSKAEAHLVEEYQEIDEKIKRVEKYLSAKDMCK